MNDLFDPRLDSEPRYTYNEVRSRGMMKRLVVFSFLLVSLGFASAMTQEDASAFRVKAQAGDLDAQYILAKALIEGDGIPKNYQEGRKWLCQSANKSHPQAMRYIIDVPPREPKAAKPHLKLKVKQLTKPEAERLGVELAKYIWCAVCDNKKPDAAKIQSLVAAGADMNAVVPTSGFSGKPVDVREAGHYNVMQAALRYGDKKLIEFFLANGASFNSNQRRLMSSLAMGGAPVKKYLLEKGSFSYKTDVELFRFILDYGANPDYWTPSGQTILSKAAGSSGVWEIGLFVEYGANINLPENPDIVSDARLKSENNGLRQTPIYKAITVAYPKVVEAFINHKADLSFKDAKGQTPLDWAMVQLREVEVSSATAGEKKRRRLDLTEVIAMLRAAGAQTTPE